MKNHFSILEFFNEARFRYEREPLPVEVIDKLLSHHLPALNYVASRINSRVDIVENLGYHEKPERLGIHEFDLTFHSFHGKGAVILSTRKGAFPRFVRLLQDTPYTRFILIPKKRLIQVDYMSKQKEFLVREGRRNVPVNALEIWREAFT